MNLDSERQAFEVDLLPEYRARHESGKDIGEYTDIVIEHDWRIWHAAWQAGQARAALTAQEPVAWCRRDTVTNWRCQLLNLAYMFPSPTGLKDPIPLYAAPPSIAPLTDEQILYLREQFWLSDDSDDASVDIIPFARAIIAQSRGEK